MAWLIRFWRGLAWIQSLLWNKIEFCTKEINCTKRSREWKLDNMIPVRNLKPLCFLILVCKLDAVLCRENSLSWAFIYSHLIFNEILLNSMSGWLDKMLIFNRASFTKLISVVGEVKIHSLLLFLCRKDWRRTIISSSSINCWINARERMFIRTLIC